jgi:hypothetical protein
MVALTPRRRCLHCKGAHTEENCPLYKKALSLYRIKDALKGDSFSGSSPAPFIGRFGYPYVNVGLLAPPEIGEHIAGYDDPRGWARKNAAIPDVVEVRSALINSRTNANIRSSPRIVGTAQEVALASKPVDLDIELVKLPSLNLHLDGTVAPMGPVAELKRVELASNPHVHTRVERAYDASDLKAADAIIDLYEHGFDENRLSKMLSVATLGIGANRKLVPTRWSITATDDTIGKRLIGQVRDSSLRHDFAAYFDGYMGNYYLVLVFPEIWGYELFESYVPSKREDGTWSFSTDNEGYKGRKDYAENTAGGYYTARLAIAERLAHLKRQASALALRFVTEEYTVPLGVWVTREACRRSMASAPRFFASKAELLAYAKQFVSERFGLDLSMLLPQSKLLKEMRQPTLAQFA